MEAEYIDGLCQRYGQLPSAIHAEDSYLHRMVETLHLGGALSPGKKKEIDKPPPKAGSVEDLANLMETL
jgi:hypothetical protein